MRIRHLFFAIFFSFLFVVQVTAAKEPDERTPIKDVHLWHTQKMMNLATLACGSVYPPPSAPKDCYGKMLRAFEKEGGAVVAPSFGLPFTFEWSFRASFGNEHFALAKETAADVRFRCQLLATLSSATECYEKFYHLALSVFDPHSAYLSKGEFAEMQAAMAGELQGVGLEIATSKPQEPLLVFGPIEGGPAEKAGIQANDLITKIDGKLVTDFKDQDEAIKAIRGNPGTTVVLEVVREGAPLPLQISIVRQKIHYASVKAQMLQDGESLYGLIKIQQFGDDTSQELEKAVRELQRKHKLSGMIVSVEGNPGGLLNEVVRAVDLFLDAESIALERNNEGIAPFAVNPQKHVPGDVTRGLPMLVVVNAFSASASEVFAGAMKHFGRAAIAGTSGTYKKGTVQSLWVAFEDGAGLKVTTAEYLVGTPSDWVPVQCLGVDPDMLFTRSDLKIPKEFKSECETEGSLRSLGGMPNPPVHTSFREANPAHFAIAESMLLRYKLHVEEQAAKRKK